MLGNDQLDEGDDVREKEITEEIETLLNRIRETRLAEGGADQQSRDMDTLLEVVRDAILGLNVRYRHYGPSSELRVEPDEWVRAEDVLKSMWEALQAGVIRDIFAGTKPIE